LTYWASTLIVKEAKINHAFKSRTGTLVRSLHSAPSGVSHTGDQNKAEKGMVLMGSKGEESEVKNNKVKFQIGSWLDYAYPVESGKHHKGGTPFPYLLPAFEKEFKGSVEYVARGLGKILNSVAIR